MFLVMCFYDDSDDNKVVPYSPSVVGALTSSNCFSSTLMQHNYLQNAKLLTCFKYLAQWSALLLFDWSLV